MLGSVRFGPVRLFKLCCDVFYCAALCCPLLCYDTTLFCSAFCLFVFGWLACLLRLLAALSCSSSFL